MLKELLDKTESDIVVYEVMNRLINDKFNYSILSFIKNDKFNISDKFLEILGEIINNLNSPIFIFYLYDLNNLKERSNEIKNRELMIIKYLIDHGNYVIVCTENKIRQYNKDR